MPVSKTRRQLGFFDAARIVMKVESQ